MNDPIAPDADSISHLDMLIELSLDDMLTEEQVAELESLIAADPKAMDELLQAQQLHADLLSLFTTIPAPSIPQPVSAQPAPAK